MKSLPVDGTRQVLLFVFIGALLSLTFFVLQPFLVAVAWAAILAYVTWPAYIWVRAKVGNRRTLAAVIMTALLALLLVVPVFWLLFMTRHELLHGYAQLVIKLKSGMIQLPQELRVIPYIGETLQNWINTINADPNALQAQLKTAGEWLVDHAGVIVGGLSRNVAKLACALLALFFLYRDGEAVVQQIRRVLLKMLGERSQGYLNAVGATTRAVVYGIFLTALAQGILAGIGYAVAGVPGPVFLTAITIVAACIPFCTPLAWGSVCVWLFLQGSFWPAIGLTIWGVFVVSWVDNIIRPMVISSATQIPFLLVMFGVLGGLTLFGMIGLFMGPVILAVMLAVWREWLDESTIHQGAS